MSFSITGGAIAQGSMVGTQCTTDWITIPCATNTNDPEMQTGSPSVCVDRICGMVFNSATTIAGSPSVAVMSESQSQSVGMEEGDDRTICHPIPSGHHTQLTMALPLISERLQMIRRPCLLQPSRFQRHITKMTRQNSPIGCKSSL